LLLINQIKLILFLILIIISFFLLVIKQTNKWFLEVILLINKSLNSHYSLSKALFHQNLVIILFKFTNFLFYLIILKIHNSFFTKLIVLKYRINYPLLTKYFISYPHPEIFLINFNLIHLIIMLLSKTWFQHQKNLFNLLIQKTKIYLNHS